MANLNLLIYVKVVCYQCGQKYAFDVLPVNNQMPTMVTCPVCCVDGTPAANQFLAQKLAEQSSVLPTANGSTVSAVVKIPSVYDVPAVASANAANDEWRRRALEAEARAEQAQAALKASLLPQLAQSLKEAVVQGLAAQRTELLQAQQAAAAEINALVHRLDELKVPMQDRLRSYEERIGELEKDLAERNEENRELLKMKIETTRRQLEAERARSRVDLN